MLVQLGINSTRDVWKFSKLDSPRRLVQFWQNFQTSLVLLIPNCTRHRMLTYTNKIQYHGNLRKFRFYYNSTFRHDIVILVNYESAQLKIYKLYTADPIKVVLPKP